MTASDDKDGESGAQILFCSICQEPAQPEENRVRLHCTRSDSEMYHANCLSKYLKVNNCKFRYGGASDRKVGYACPAHPKCRVRNTNTIPANRARRKPHCAEPITTSGDDGVVDPPPPAAAPAPARVLAPMTAPESNAKTGCAPATKTVRVLNAGRLPPIPLPVVNNSSSSSSSSSGSGGGGTESDCQGKHHCCTAASAPELSSMAADPEAGDDDEEFAEHACFNTEGNSLSRVSFNETRTLRSSKGNGFQSNVSKQPPSAWTSPNHTKSKILSVARAPNPWTRTADKKKKSVCTKGRSGRVIRSAAANRAKFSPGDRKEGKQVLSLPVPEPLTPVNGSMKAAAAAHESLRPLQQTRQQQIPAASVSADDVLSGNSIYCATEDDGSVMVVPVAWVQPILDRSSAWAAGPPPSAASQQQRMAAEDNTSSPILPGKAAAAAAAAAPNTVSPFSVFSFSSAEDADDGCCDDQADEDLCSILLNSLISGM